MLNTFGKFVWSRFYRCTHHYMECATKLCCLVSCNGHNKMALIHVVCVCVCVLYKIDNNEIKYQIVIHCYWYNREVNKWERMNEFIQTILKVKKVENGLPDWATQTESVHKILQTKRYNSFKSDEWGIVMESWLKIDPMDLL